MKIERETKRSDRSLRRDCAEPQLAFSTQEVLKLEGGWRHGLLSGQREGRQDREEGEVGKAKATNSFIHIS